MRRVRAGTKRRLAWKEKREARENRIVIWIIVVTILAGFIAAVIVAFMMSDGDAEDSAHDNRGANSNTLSIHE